MRRSSVNRAGQVVALLALLAYAVPAGAEIYRYVDEQGNTHLTGSSDAIPSRYRASAEEISGRVARNDSLNVVPGLNRPPRKEEDEEGLRLPRPARAIDRFEPTQVQAPEAVPPQQLEAMKALGALGPAVWVVVLLLTAVGFALSGLVLCLACRVVGEDVPSLGRAIAILLVQAFANFGVGLIAALAGILLGGAGFLQGPSSAVVSIVLTLAVSAKVVASMLQLAFTRGLVIILVHGVLCVLIFGVPVLLIGWLAGAFSLPTG